MEKHPKRKGRNNRSCLSNILCIACFIINGLVNSGLDHLGITIDINAVVTTNIQNDK